MSNPKKYRIESYLNTLKVIGRELPDKMSVLDLGCGNGSVVKALMLAGHNAYGCDFQYKEGPFVEELSHVKRIRIIEQGEEYRLPFNDESMDLVISDQVFEHVNDYEGCFSEIKRILRSDGMSLHIFPSRYTLVEPHLFIPLGTIIKNKWWIGLWTLLGVRRRIDRDKSISDVIEDNYSYLTTCTNYLCKADILEHLASHFTTYAFREDAFLKQNKKARHLLKIIPFLPPIYSTFRDRVMYMEK